MVSLKSLWLLVFCAGLRAFGQFSAATVTGVVQDSSKAAITDAKLKLINTQTGTENDSVTDAVGGFLLPGILPGAYTLQIERQGFATTQVNGVALNDGDTRNLLIRMKVGPVTETVSVDASGLTLNTTDAAVSTIVDRKLIATIPINGRSLQDLVLATPGIVTQSPQAAGTSATQTQEDLSVNGQPTSSNSFFVDGVAANNQAAISSGATHLGSTGSIAGTTALGTTQSLISADALQEFRVLSSTYSAEYGRTPGGQFTFLTRSGGNHVHGSVYEHVRGNYLDASDWFAGSQHYADPARYSQNDFGATLGAPLSLPRLYNGRDKSFFFLSSEELSLDQPTPQAFPYGPTVCFDYYYPGSPCPSAMFAVLRTFPSPYFLSEFDPYSGSPGLAITQVYGASFPTHVSATSLRVDHTFSPQLSMFFRYANTPSAGQSNQLYSTTLERIGDQSFTYGATNQITANEDNELRWGFTWNDTHLRTFTDNPGEVAGGDSIISRFGDLDAALGIPGFNTAAGADAYIHITGIGDSDSNTGQMHSSLSQWNLRDTYSLRAHNHLLKFGFDERHIQAHVSPAPLSILADFFTLGSMLENSASDLVITRRTPADPVWNEFSLFAEDEWKVSPSLNVSAGLRWDVNPAPKGQHGQDAFTVLGDIQDPATLRLAPRGTPLWHTSWVNLAPRLGAAWLARDEPGRELILRAGGGVFFDTGTRPAFAAFTGIGFANSAHFLNVPVPATAAQVHFPAAAGYTEQQAFAFAPHLQQPYSLQWNVSAEQALGKNQSLTISYVGALGRRLLVEQRKNVSGMNHEFGDVTYFPSGITSNFQSLQTKFQRSLFPGLEVLGSYTWAHSLDYGSTDPAYPLIHGNSGLDVRQNLEAAATWSSRPATHRAFRPGRFLEGWGLDSRLIARTGFPVDLLGNFAFDPITGRPFYSGVDLVPGKPLYLNNSMYPGGRVFNGGQNAIDPAFALPDGPGPGNAPRNFVRGFPAVQENFAARQNLHLAEQWNMELRLDLFNVANHPNFGYIDPSLSDKLFGQSTKMLNQSFGSAGALYNQGGPRSIQLSVKVTF